MIDTEYLRKSDEYPLLEQETAVSDEPSQDFLACEDDSLNGEWYHLASVARVASSYWRRRLSNSYAGSQPEEVELSERLDPRDLMALRSFDGAPLEVDYTLQGQRDIMPEEKEMESGSFEFCESARDDRRRQLMLAESPYVTLEILRELAFSPHADVREAVADHLQCPMDILEQLLIDECPDVRFAMAENHNMNIQILEVLVEDSNPFVADRAQRTITRIMTDRVGTDKVVKMSLPIVAYSQEEAELA